MPKEKMPKFKRGDIVIPSEFNPGQLRNHIGWEDEMMGFVGRPQKITYSSPGGAYYQLEGGAYYWPREALKLYDPEHDGPFTQREQIVMNLLAEAHNKFLNLDRSSGHPMEVQEWISSIHQLQSIMEHRAMKRLFPKYFN